MESGIFLSTDNGHNWRKVSLGLTDSTALQAIAVNGTDLFAGTVAGGVWRRPLSEMLTGVGEQRATSLPVTPELHANYPNPFSGSTTISFALPERSPATLVVWNSRGEQVATLARGTFDAGLHSAVFNTNGLADGPYIYRLQAGDHREAKFLLLLR
jgi:hypothetical protein